MSIERHLSETVGSRASLSGESPNFQGTWTNRLESEMELVVDMDGKVNGKYRTGVGRPAPIEEFDLRGFARGDLIVFCVDFGGYGSLASWAGQHTRDDDGNEIIYTLWHLARNVPDEDEPDQLWAGILAGANEFRRAG